MLELVLTLSRLFVLGSSLFSGLKTIKKENRMIWVKIECYFDPIMILSTWNKTNPRS